MEKEINPLAKAIADEMIIVAKEVYSDVVKEKDGLAVAVALILSDKELFKACVIRAKRKLKN